MIVNHLQDCNSILNNFIAEIRDVKIQKDPMRFRRNIERIGEVLAFEISKNLHFQKTSIQTPLGTKETQILDPQPVVCSILRAGLPLHQGFLNYFDHSENAFISAFRHHPNNDAEFEIVTEYIAAPSIEGKTLIVVDPMLATGRSLISVLDVLKSHGTPKEIHIACVIAAKPGVEFLKNSLKEKVHLWVASIDNELNDQDYIVPGLGDAGDLSFGPKL